jgi:copper chaperone
MKQIFTVKGMTCGHCEKAVSKAVQALDAQARIVIDRTEQRVEIDTVVERQALVQAIEDEGYSVLA